MTLQFPWALLGLLVIPFFVLRNRTSLAPAPARRRAISTGVRIAIFTLLVVALSDPRMLRQTDARHVVWLVDRSRSVGDAATTKAVDLSTKIGQPPGTETWVAFGGGSALTANATETGKVDPAAVRDAASDLSGAIQLAQALFPAGATKTIALVSDGVATTGDPADLLTELRAANVRIQAIPAAPPEKPETLVRSVRAPRQVRVGEPFRVDAEIESNREGPAEISVFRNGVRIASRTETLRPGSQTFTFTETMRGEDRLAEISVEVRAAADQIVDNNRASALVQTEGLSKVLLIADKPDQARFLAWALRQEGIVLDARPPTGAPTTIADLQNYDLLVLDNVPATDLEPEQMALFATWVKDFGGGFLMTGGDQSFGLGGYYRTPIEDLLPVRCDFEKDQETPSLGIVFVIDRSGSMSGEKIEMAKDAAKAALELLSPKDYAGVVAFDNEAFWVADVQSASDKSGIAQKISAIQEGGGTNIAPGMELAYRALTTAPAKLKHVILLTDGVSTPGPFYELATQMAAENITVSTVAVGGDADMALLEQIATWGSGRYYLAEDPRSVPQIFAKETMTASKSALQEAPFVPIVVRPADFLAGIDFKSAPFLLGYVTTRTKPTAELWMVSEKGEPILATWRYGLGKAGAWTSDARSRWAVEWLRWDGFGRFWAQLARSLSRTGAVRRFPVTLEREGDGFVLRADTVDASGRLLTGLDAEVVLSRPDGSTETLPVPQDAPGHFEKRLDGTAGGVVHAQLTFRRGGEVVERQTLSASSDYPLEWVPRPLDTALLTRLAAETGGVFDPAPEAVWKDDRRSIEEAALWPWLVGAAVFLFVLDVALKRWPAPARGAASSVRPPSPQFQST